MKWLDKKDGKTQTMDNCMDNKPERRSPLIDWLMGVEQNSVYLSRILVVGCAGLFEYEELVGPLTGDQSGVTKSSTSTDRYSHFSSERNHMKKGLVPFP